MISEFMSFVRASTLMATFAEPTETIQTCFVNLQREEAQPISTLVTKHTHVANYTRRITICQEILE